MRLPPTDSASPVQHQTPIQPKPRAPWILLLPLLLGAGIMWQQTRDTPTPEIRTPERIRPRPLRKPTPPATPQPATAPKTAIEYSIPTTIWVPGDDEKLHAKPFKNNVPVTGSVEFPAVHTRWMNAVVEATPELFPPGTRVKSVRVGSDSEPAQVDFNAAFAKPGFWNGELRTQMAIYSVVNTLSTATPSQNRPVPVQILVEGKRIETLGEFDASDPIEPDFSLNAAAAPDAGGATNTKDAANANNALSVANPDAEGRAKP